jgi:branched-subunit amino acid transport protein
MQLSIRRGESVFNKILVNSFLSLLALLVAYFALWRGQKRQRIWYIIAVVAAVISGFAFWLSRSNGVVLLIGAVLLIGLGELFRKK